VEYGSDTKYRYLSNYIEFVQETVFFPVAGVSVRVFVTTEAPLQPDSVLCQECGTCIATSPLPQLVVNWNWSEISETNLMTIVSFTSTLV